MTQQTGTPTTASAVTPVVPLSNASTATPAASVNTGNTKAQNISTFNAKHADANSTGDDKSDKIKQAATNDMATKAAAAKQAAAAKAATEEQKRQDANHAQALLMAAQAGQEQLANTARPAATWLANLPTPGGILLLLVIIGFFLLVVVPVDKAGNTRFKLILLTLRGNTHLSYEDGSGTPAAPPASSTGSPSTGSTGQNPSGGSGSIPGLGGNGTNLMPLSQKQQVQPNPTNNNSNMPVQIPANVNFFSIMGLE